MKLTPTQERVYANLTDEPKSAYDLRAKLATLRALVKKGKAKDVTPPGPGALFSPSTHFVFIRQ